MAKTTYYDGSYYVLYADGSTELCHNKATADYLVKKTNES